MVHAVKVFSTELTTWKGPILANILRPLRIGGHDLCGVLGVSLSPGST